jgi:hypothetical protein
VKCLQRSLGSNLCLVSPRNARTGLEGSKRGEMEDRYEGSGLGPWLRIGPPLGIFSVPGFVLVRPLEYSRSLALYWSALWNILGPWLRIGPPFGIFSVPGFVLVPPLEYSRSLASYWSPVRNILGPWLRIVPPLGIFSVPGFVLVPH